jgi:HEAT repeat protein
MEVFLSLLSHPESKIRESAVRTLRYVGGQEALLALKHASNDPSEMVRMFARRAVRALEGPPERLTYDTGGPIDLSATPLGKPDPIDRTIVALLLGRDVPATQAQYVASLLSHPDATLRHAAHEFIARNKHGADAFYAELARHQLPLNSELIELLSSIGDDRARDLLLRSACDDNDKVSDACFKALRRFNMESALDSLIELFRHIPDYRDSDVAALFKRAGSEGAERLLDLFRRDGSIRRRRGRLLALVVGESALPLLMDALESPFREVRESAAQGLVALESPAAQSLVRQLPKMASVPGQKAGLRALYAINYGKSDLATPETLRCVAEMASRRSTRTEALALLGRIRSPWSYSLLLNLLRSEDLTLARAAMGSCEQLVWGGVKPPVEIIRAVATLARQPYAGIQRRALGLLVYALLFPTEVQIAVIFAFLEFLRSRDVALAGCVTDMLNAEPDKALRAIDAAIGAGAADIDALEQLRESILAKRKELAITRHGSSDVEMPSPKYSLSEPSYPVGHAIPRPLSAMTKMSVTAPRTVVPASRFVLAVWVHRGGDSVVLRHAQSMASGKPITAQTKLALQIPDRSVLEVVIDLPGFQLDEESDTMYWDGGTDPIGNCTFGVTVPPDAAFGTHLGKASLWLSGLRIAKLDFALEVGAEGTGVQDMTVDEHQARTAFASYASEELSQVLARIQGMQKVLPDLDIFLDIVSLRSGEDWKNRLSHEIADRDLFLLFWSLAASRSQWVQREWQTALEAKGLEAINPVPLEPPSVAPPPPELSSLHFHDWTLAVNSR